VTFHLEAARVPGPEGNGVLVFSELCLLAVLSAHETPLGVLKQAC
jgi:hypothetical protein